MERAPGIQFNIPAQQRVRRNDHVSACGITHRPGPLVQVPVGDGRPDPGCELLQLILPVVEQGGRSNDQGWLAPFTDIRQLRAQRSDAL
ncbi:hypothetical protein D3C85_1773020 [compost metagenome]